MFGFKIKKDNKKNNQDNSKIFFDLPSKEKVKILRQVIREANKEQNAILLEYGRKDACAKCK
jgi:isopenicillin N synthase-like dioxygenase